MVNTNEEVDPFQQESDVELVETGLHLHENTRYFIKDESEDKAVPLSLPCETLKAVPVVRHAKLHCGGLTYLVSSPFHDEQRQICCKNSKAITQRKLKTTNHTAQYRVMVQLGVE